MGSHTRLIDTKSAELQNFLEPPRSLFFSFFASFLLGLATPRPWVTVLSLAVVKTLLGLVVFPRGAADFTSSFEASALITSNRQVSPARGAITVTITKTGIAAAVSFVEFFAGFALFLLTSSRFLIAYETLTIFCTLRITFTSDTLTLFPFPFDKLPFAAAVANASSRRLVALDILALVAVL